MAKKSETYRSIEKLNDDIGGDEFLELKLKNSSSDYICKTSSKSDKELWLDARKEKYEL